MAQHAIVIVDHGSRSGEANALLGQVVDALARRWPERAVYAAHLELTEPSLESAIDRAVAEGAREITVGLWFLSPGRHSKRDIPAKLRAAERQHPRVTFAIGAPLGAAPATIEVLVERLANATPPRAEEPESG